jgi:hypothetical protein
MRPSTRKFALQLNGWFSVFLILCNAATAGHWLSPDASGCFEAAVFVEPLIFASRVFFVAALIRAALLRRWTPGMLSLAVFQAIAMHLNFRQVTIFSVHFAFFSMAALGITMAVSVMIDRRNLPSVAEKEWPNQPLQGTQGTVPSSSTEPEVRLP